MVCKGVGVYSLMAIAADMVNEKNELPHLDWQDFFRIKLGAFAPLIDWTTRGPLKGLGGEAGVKEATEILRLARKNAKLKVI